MTLDDPIQLIEYSEKSGVRLTRQQAFDLGATRRSEMRSGKPTQRRVLRVEPEREDGLYTLTANSIVGGVRVGPVQVSIIPKVGVGKTAMMLSHSLESVSWRNDLLMQGGGDLVESLVLPFLSEVESIIRAGKAEAYVLSEEVGSRPRGAVDFSWSNGGLPSPVRFRFEDFASDIPENRIVRSALEHVLRVEGLARLGGMHAAQLLDAFEGVRLASHLDHERLPMDARYDRVLNFANMIFSGAGIEPEAGRVESSSLLFDMNVVFENFVCALVRQTFPLGEVLVDSQGVRKPRFLGEHRSLKVHPDFAIWTEGKCRLIGDVKYKLLNGRLRRADLYQALAYAAACGTDRALLVYVGSGETVRQYVPAMGVSVYAVPIDIEALDAEQISQSIKEAVVAAYR